MEFLGGMQEDLCACSVAEPGTSYREDIEVVVWDS